MNELRRYGSLGVLLVAMWLGLPPQPADADTGGDRTYTCPLCSKNFESFTARSGTSFGSRLDFKEVGPIRSPWPIPRCSHCGFVIYSKELDEAKKATLRLFVASDAYAPVWKGHTHYYCMGLILEACEKKEKIDLSTVFLKATWELEDTDERFEAYATKAIAALGAVRPPAEDAEGKAAIDAREDYLIARYLRLELQRRCGAFAAALETLKEIATLDRGQAPTWYEKAIAFQTTLVKKQDKAPHEFREIPDDEGDEAGDDDEDEAAGAAD